MFKDIKLRKYQQDVLDELACIPSIGLFIKTGGGKTITSLQKAFDNKSKYILVICPQRVVTQWADVIEEHTTFRPIRYKMSWSSVKKWETIKEELDKKKENQVVIINYDIITKTDIENYIDDNWTIIVDESHRIKNYPKYDRKGKCKSGHTTEKILKLGELTPFKVILTATPTEKLYGGYIDLYSQLRFLGYMDLSYQGFKNKYCQIVKRQLPGIPVPLEEIIGYETERIENELKPILRCCCRYYSPNYGDYEPQLIKVDIDKCLSYNKVRDHRVYKEITFDNSSAYRIGRMTLTSGIISGSGEYGEKLTYLDNTNKKDWVVDFLKDTDDKVAILYNYNVELKMLEDACREANKKYIVINGKIKDKPAELKKEFDVVLGQYEAFGESLDGLQYKCHLMIFYSMPYSSRAYKQSLGRIDRDGQTEMPIYYHLVMKGTIDEPIYSMVHHKIDYQERDLNELKEE